MGSVLLAPPVSNSHMWAAFPFISHFTFKSPPSVSPLQVDVSSPGAPRVAFQAWLPTARHLCQPPERADWSPLARQHRTRFRCVCQRSGRAASASPPSTAAWAGLHHHGHRVHLLGIFLLLRTLQGIPQAWVRLNPALIILFPLASAFTFTSSTKVSFIKHQIWSLVAEFALWPP